MDEKNDFLQLEDLDSDPIRQFDKWFAEAAASGVSEPEAAALATSSPGGKPSLRMVLVKGYDQRGFVFYTNYESRKAGEIEQNPSTALTFYWPSLSRQVRIEGTVEKTSETESRGYFDSREFKSRLAAWASAQSKVIQNRRLLDNRMRELERKYSESGCVPLPPFWGGYRLRPLLIEFWQQGPHRLHDRFRFSRTSSGWVVERLSP